MQTSYLIDEPSALFYQIVTSFRNDRHACFLKNILFVFTEQTYHPSDLPALALLLLLLLLSAERAGGNGLYVARYRLLALGAEDAALVGGKGAAEFLFQGADNGGDAVGGGLDSYSGEGPTFKVID